MRSLEGTITVVTGASRGAGRGIALALGEAGATVYVTGRSIRGEETTENMPGTIDDTADEVTARGGRGIAARCDHTSDADVEQLFTRIRDEQGKIDLLVNNVWGGYEHHEGEGFVAPFWEQPLRHWDGMFTAGVRAHLLASRYAAPMMVAQRRGLIVNTTAWLHGKYLGNTFYDVAKAAVNRLAFAMAHDLRQHNVAAVALAPGFMRTERVLAAHAAQPFDLGNTESPEYIGRGIVALAGDVNVMEKSGQQLYVGDLAVEYGFTDVDGRQVPVFVVG